MSTLLIPTVRKASEVLHELVIDNLLGYAEVGSPGRGTRASTEKKKDRSKQAAAAAAAQELQALQARHALIVLTDIDTCMPDHLIIKTARHIFK